MFNSLKKIFLGDGGQSKSAEKIEYEGYVIEPAPIKEGGQYRLAAKITKQIDGETKRHNLIRADLFGEYNDAVKFAVAKAQQVIKEQGDKMFS